VSGSLITDILQLWAGDGGRMTGTRVALWRHGFALR
jgi:hypothetical protein